MLTPVNSTVQTLIDDSFEQYVAPLHARMIEGTCCNYTETGKSDYHFYNETSMQGTSALKICAEEFSHKEHFSVLELGTGNGAFLASLKDSFPNVDVAGVSAADFRSSSWGHKEINDKITDSEYLVANLENLDQIEALKDRTFDAIFSQMTMMHMSNPLGLIVKAYDKLNPGGIFMFDHFHLHGININDYVECLENSGCADVEIAPKKYYETATGKRVLWPIDIQLTKIRKGSEHLHLPIAYDLEKSTPAKGLDDPDCNKAIIFYKRISDTSA